MTISQPLRALVVLLGVLVLLLPTGSSAPRVLAAEPEATLATNVLYRVSTDAGQIQVVVDVTFTNRAPDPPGGFTFFDEAPLAIHDGATQITATDQRGDLQVKAAKENGVNVARVTLRAPLRYNKAAAFTLRYVLPDGAAGGIRVRPSVTVFPAWGFGTTSNVAVELPDGYTVSVQGDDLSEADAPSEGVTRLVSGPIEKPAEWVALVTADRATSYTPFTEVVRLESGTADLRVQAWADDDAWGERTLDLLDDALPALERAIGLPYQHVGPLTVTESVQQSRTGFDGEAAAAEIRLGFDQPPFTALHEATHVWIGPSLFESRWIYEGLASYYAEVVARELEESLPYDPAKVRDERRASAFPLEEWKPAEEATVEQDAYAYPASWALAREIAARAGDETLRELLARVARGQGAYDGAEPAAEAGSEDGAGTSGTSGPVDGRQLLDHLEELTGKPFDDLFRAHVFSPDVAELLAARAAARTAYHELLSSAGEWGAPGPVARAMASWDFAAATAAIEEAAAWLPERDRLITDLERAGLSVPARLRDRYRHSGGDAEAYREVEAERQVLDRYVVAQAAVTPEPSLLQRIGLLGGPAPVDEVRRAGELFAAGDLTGALDTLEAAQDRYAGAHAAGLLRLASLALMAVAFAVFLVVRRRRRVSNGPSD